MSNASYLLPSWYLWYRMLLRFPDDDSGMQSKQLVTFLKIRIHTTKSFLRIFSSKATRYRRKGRSGQSISLSAVYWPKRVIAHLTRYRQDIDRFVCKKYNNIYVIYEVLLENYYSFKVSLQNINGNDSLD